MKQRATDQAARMVASICVREREAEIPDLPEPELDQAWLERQVDNLAWWVADQFGWQADQFMNDRGDILKDALHQLARAAFDKGVWGERSNEFERSQARSRAFDQALIGTLLAQGDPLDQFLKEQEAKSSESQGD